jgi:hypothetical protein|tara:strand:- start:51 stop:236 length:186 start_codon:yes stop_codon:yes gene_type:complete
VGVEVAADMRVVVVLPLVEVVHSMGQAVAGEALLAGHTPLKVEIGVGMQQKMRIPLEVDKM